MKIYLGSDHNGFYLKGNLKKYLLRAGYDVEDEGDEQLDPQDDYPLFAQKVVRKVLSSKDDDPRGILLCGSGQGMCMAANRFKGIRACLGYDRTSVRSARHDDNSNILCLPASSLDKETTNLVVETWLNTPFGATPRYKRRLQEIDEMN